MMVSHVNKSSLQRIFDGLMSAFNSAVGRGMICRGKPDFYPEGLHDVPVEVGNEAVPVVGHGRPGRPVPGDPLEEGS